MTRNEFHTWLIGHMHVTGFFGSNFGGNPMNAFKIDEFGDAVLRAAHSVPVYLAFSDRPGAPMRFTPLDEDFRPVEMPPGDAP